MCQTLRLSKLKLLPRVRLGSPRHQVRYIPCLHISVYHALIPSLSLSSLRLCLTIIFLCYITQHQKPSIAVVKAVEMCEETKGLFRTESSVSVLKSCFDRQFEALISRLKPIFANGSAQPFAKVIVRISKLFDTEILPAKVNGVSFVLDDLKESKEVDQFCSIVFFPLSGDSSDNPVLNPEAFEEKCAAQPSPARIEVIEDESKEDVIRGVEANPPTLAESVAAVQSPPEGISGVPSFNAH